MRDLELLKALLANGTFHHATYCCIGTDWEGLWFYKIGHAGHLAGHLGYDLEGCVNASDRAALLAAEELLASLGIPVHVGAYGQG